jgi:soluble lytic murein transglycosylase-like protein
LPISKAARRGAGWRRLAGRVAALASRRLRQAFAVCLAVASTSVPAGTPDKSETTARLKQQREFVARTAQVVEEARVAHIAQRYRKPPEQVRRVVRTTERVAARHGLPPALLLAIVETESSFNASARSNYGARGLMQVVPRFHPKVVKAIGGAHKLDEPEANLEAGAAILASYLESSGSLPKALRRYSGGAGEYASKISKRQLEFESIAIHATRQLDAVRVSELRSAQRGS